MFGLLVAFEDGYQIAYDLEAYVMPEQMSKRYKAGEVISEGINKKPSELYEALGVRMVNISKAQRPDSFEICIGYHGSHLTCKDTGQTYYIGDERQVEVMRGTRIVHQEGFAASNNISIQT